MKSLLLFACLAFALPTFATGPDPEPAKVEAKAAAAAVPAPAPAKVAEELPPAPVVKDEIPVTDFMGQVLKAIKDFGGVDWVMRVALVITLLLSSMKVSVLNQLIWSKLGSFKAWAAPALGLIAGVVDLKMNGQLTAAGVLAWVSAGAGAIILHELLDTVKSIPGLGKVWVELIGVVSSFLGGAKKQA